MSVWPFGLFERLSGVAYDVVSSLTRLSETSIYRDNGRLRMRSVECIFSLLVGRRHRGLEERVRDCALCSELLTYIGGHGFVLCIAVQECRGEIVVTLVDVHVARRTDFLPKYDKYRTEIQCVYLPNWLLLHGAASRDYRPRREDASARSHHPRALRPQRVCH